MRTQTKRSDLTQQTILKKEASLSSKFHQYIIDKAVNWALQSTNGKARFSELKWGDEERAIINQIIENPKAADLKLPVQDSKFKSFFKSIAENGLNTLDLEMFYRYRDRLPLRDLHWEFKKEDFVFTKTKVTSKEVIPAGYYMLELGIKTEKFSSQIEFDLTTGEQPKSKNQLFELQAKSNRISKRLIYLGNNSKLGACLTNNIKETNIYHLRLARLTKNFFLSRLLSKIGHKFDIKGDQIPTDEEFKVFWERYDSIFKRVKNAQSEYEYYIHQVEAKQTLSRAQQLKNLQQWMMKNR